MESVKKWFTRLSYVVDKVVSVVYYVLLFASIVALVGFGTDKLAGGNGDVYGYKPIVIQTGSMQPAIKEKAIIVGKAFDGHDVKVGDIVVFTIYEEGRDKYITHRVIDVNPETQTVSTKGDANNVVDLFDVNEYPNGLPMDNLVYRVDTIWNGVAPLLHTLSTSYMASILLIVIGVSIFITWKLLKDLFYDIDYDPAYRKQRLQLADEVKEVVGVSITELENKAVIEDIPQEVLEDCNDGTNTTEE